MTAELPREIAAATNATLQHIALLQGREARLRQAREDAEDQMLHRLGVAYRTGEIDERHLLTVFERYRQLSITGRLLRWNKHISIPWNRMKYIHLSFTNGPAGTWVGEYPCAPDAPAPREGINVVYVLYEADSEPCYVGSTNNLRQRLKAHAKDGKVFAHWRAYRCRNREHAYELEDRLLKEHKPRLNRKASR